MTWSYELLPDVERQLLCSLSVFPSSWTLEAAEDVCAGDGMDRMDMLDLLSHLVDKSLVIVDAGATGDRRYRFLETVRQCGRERLFQSGKPRDGGIATWISSPNWRGERKPSCAPPIRWPG